MSDLQDEIHRMLSRSADQLDHLRASENLGRQLRKLAKQAYQPCVVAVVGKVNAGKSSFVNALLGQDLAQVGDEETTATINYFRSGKPDPALPVKCYWHDAPEPEDVTKKFLDSLQGHSEEALKQAAQIDRLEFLSEELPQNFVLVDTPGLGSVIKEHQSQACKILRQKHDRETQLLARDADAVIYVIGEVARAAGPVPRGRRAFCREMPGDGTTDGAANAARVGRY